MPMLAKMAKNKLLCGTASTVVITLVVIMNWEKRFCKDCELKPGIFRVIVNATTMTVSPRPGLHSLCNERQSGEGPSRKGDVKFERFDNAARFARIQ